MVIERIIVHELVKNPQSKGASLDLSKDLSIKDSINEKLIAELDCRYNRLTITNARFKTPADVEAEEKKDKDSVKSTEGAHEYVNKFRVAMDEYYKTKEDQSFIDFTKDVMKELERIIKDVWLAKGGYFVLADYDGYLGVFLIRHREGMFFIKQGGTFRVNSTIGIDFEKMALACRIDKEKFAHEEGRYLSFVSAKNEPISQYFTDWFSIKDVEDNRKDTINMMDILRDIDPPKDTDKIEFMEDVYTEIKIAPDGKVNLKTLGSRFYGDEQKVIDYAEKKNIQINHEFIADAKILKKFPFIRAKAEKIDIRFPRELYKNKIKLDQKKQNLIIIDSLLLANELRKQLGLNTKKHKKTGAIKAVDKKESRKIEKTQHPGINIPLADAEDIKRKSYNEQRRIP
jgi:nucleoid-associated protein YejK